MYYSLQSTVCPSVAYIANNSRTQRPSVSKFGRKVHLWCDSLTSFRPINADTHIFRTDWPTNFKLGRPIRMEDDDPHQPQAPWPPRSKVRVARSRDQFEASWSNAVRVGLSLEAGGAYRVGRTKPPHFFLNVFSYYVTVDALRFLAKRPRGSSLSDKTIRLLIWSKFQATLRSTMQCILPWFSRCNK